MVNRSFYIAFIAILGVFVVTLVSLQSSSVSLVKKNAKIYDCVHLNGDISLLENHLAKLDHLVDVFVILEQVSEPGKESVYQNNQSRLANYQAKIIYLSTHRSDLDDTSLKREYLKALEGCADHDVILFSSLSLPLEAKEVSKGALWLAQHPDQFIQLKKGGVNHRASTDTVKAATYFLLKSCFLDGPNYKVKYKTHIIDHTGIFFPV